MENFLEHGLHVRGYIRKKGENIKKEIVILFSRSGSWFSTFSFLLPL